VKLEKRLLNDPRWWIMSEPAQLIYIKLILLAAETYNKIPQNDEVLREALRSRLDIETFKNCLNEIFRNFPKLKNNKYYRYFAEFETKTNYLPKREIRRKSQVFPKEAVDKEKDKDKEKEKEKKCLSDSDFINSLKNNIAYKHIDIDQELGKIDAWLLTQKNRQKTRRFVVAWLNRIDRPLPKQPPRPEPKHEKIAPPDPKQQEAVSKLIHATVVKMNKKKEVLNVD